MKKSCDILCLQETHSTPEDESLWELEWGNKILFSHGTSSSRGVAVLYRKLFKWKINDIRTDQHGRYVTCRININDVTVVLGNVYGPNDPCPNFFEQLIRGMYQQCNDIVLVGDFNCCARRAKRL